MYVKATDGGTPAKSSRDNGRVNIRVTRNNFTPRWEGTLPYVTTVNENQDLNTQVFQVRTRDDDPEVRENIVTSYERHGVSNHGLFDCLFHSLFKLATK